jgi:hypothetical protein
LKLRSPAVLFAVGVVATIVLAVGVVLALVLSDDANAVSDNAPLIAAVIALGGVGTAQMVSIALEDQRTREARALEDRQTQEARVLEAQRTQEARVLEVRRAGEAALQNYFEAVGELLIEKSLRRASPGDNLSTVVRAQTLSVLEGLDPDRKRILLLFLYESGLVYKDKRVVSLTAANLSKAFLRNTNLHGANLAYADLRGADLSGADLSGVNLRGAALSEAHLSEAHLSEAHGWTEEQLSEVSTLAGATMPDGQILQGDAVPYGTTFEAWRKDRERRGKDEEYE